MQVATLRAKYAALVPMLTERSRRVWAAAEARAIGYGGIAVVGAGDWDRRVDDPAWPARS